VKARDRWRTGLRLLPLRSLQLSRNCTVPARAVHLSVVEIEVQLSSEVLVYNELDTPGWSPLRGSTGYWYRDIRVSYGALERDAGDPVAVNLTDALERVVHTDMGRLPCGAPACRDSYIHTPLIAYPYRLLRQPGWNSLQQSLPVVHGAQ